VPIFNGASPATRKRYKKQQYMIDELFASFRESRGVGGDEPGAGSSRNTPTVPVLATQLEQVRRFCNERGWIIASEFIENGGSGTSEDP
jgi:hypothetical protein